MQNAAIVRNQKLGDRRHHAFASERHGSAQEQDGGVLHFRPTAGTIKFWTKSTQAGFHQQGDFASGKVFVAESRRPVRDGYKIIASFLMPNGDS